jgi:multidrug resistance protein, MATE family
VTAATTAPAWRDRVLHRQVWRLALPIVLSNMTVPLLGLVDTAVIGHLDAPVYLAAVAVGALIFTFLYWTFIFLRMGTGGLTAQAFGAGDGDEIRAALARPMLVAAGLAALMLALQGPIAWGAFAIVEANAGVEALAREYFFIRVWGAPATLANFVLLGWFLGMQNSRAMLAQMVCVNAVNIALDLIFVVGLEMGVAGVAAASAIAEYAGLALGLVIATRILKASGGRWERARILDAQALRHTVAVNRDIFVRTVLLIAAFAYFTMQGARLGEVVLAANAVLMNFFTIYSHAVDSFSHAVEAMVGRALGARSRTDFVRAVTACTVWALGVSLLVTVIFAVAGGPIVRGLTDLADVRAVAAAHLGWLIALPLVTVAAFVLDGVFVGTTRGREMRNSMIVCFALYMPMAWYLPTVWGNHGLWAAMLALMVFRGVTLGWLYARIERRGGFVKG